MTNSDTIRRALANARQCDELATRLNADAEAVRDLYGPYLGGTEPHPHVVAIQEAASHARQAARKIREQAEQLPGYAEYTSEAMDEIGMTAVFGKE